MLEVVTGLLGSDPGGWIGGFFGEVKNYVLIFAGFSLVIFFHELGHFIAAKACGVRVDKFAVGFGRAVVSYRKGIGFRWGSTQPEVRRRVSAQAEATRLKDLQFKNKPETSEPDLAQATRDLGIGETEYCFNWLPMGGYVKMLGQEDFTVDKSGELMVKEDPRAFTHKPVGQRMIIVSSGVVMNLLFAAFVFMMVFMIGVDFPPAEVGWMELESPAERSGLHVGDRILKINRQEISDFNDIPPAILLSDPEDTLEMQIARPATDGGEPTIQTIELRPERYRDETKRQIGVAPPMNNVVAIALPDPALAPEAQLQAGDEIVAVNGKKVSTLLEINEAIVALGGAWADLSVRRPSEFKEGQPQEVTMRRRATLTLRSTGDAYKESGHLLGFVPRRQITRINPGDPADRSGFKFGDVIVRWGNQPAPTLEEVLDSVKNNADRDIHATVRRRSPDGKETTLELEVRPRIPGWFGGGKPKIGMDPMGQEDDRVVVADIVSDVTEELATPAATLKGKMPRGSLITNINGEPVTTWVELASRFIRLAGKKVQVAWSYEGQPEQSGEIYIPQTLGTTFQLPPEDRITKINGRTHVEISVDGKRTPFSADNWRGAREILRECIGQTVEVEHRSFLDRAPKVEKVAVTKEMLDTWVQRIQYQVIDSMVTELVMTKVQVKNPAKAMKIGIMKTYYFIEQVYMMMKRMIFTRSVSMDQVSGPVGIVKLGSDIARQDFVKLMYFLALISANLAVINFLPLPIVDGGLFVFLLVEKIKGSPISIRVQVATQIIGLVLIIGIFLYVTIQDVGKLLG